MANPRTIDDLPTSTSVTWATDQAVVGKGQHVPETALRTIAGAARKEVVSPVLSDFPETIDRLFELFKRNPPWAYFDSPPGFSDQTRSFFTFQIVPALGSLDSSLERIKVFEESGEQKEGREVSTLLRCLTRMSTLDEILEFIKLHCTQFQKG